MAASIRLISKTVEPSGQIYVSFSDNTGIVFSSQLEYDSFVNLPDLDRNIIEVMKRVLMAWSHNNQDAVGKQCIFDANEISRNVMRIRN